MNKKILFIVLLFIPFFSFARFGHLILKNHNLPLSKIKQFNNQEIEVFREAVLNIFEIDQRNRNVKSSFISNGVSVDSANFITYYNFVKKNGFYSMNFHFWEFQYCLAYQKQKIKIAKDLECNQLKKAINNDSTAVGFAEMNRVLLLHFSDRNGFEMLDLIEKSILNKRQTCDEEDLMNYFVTYLTRNTMFDNNKLFGQIYHVVLLPDLTSGSFSIYYRYALNKFLAFSHDVDKNFRSLCINNLTIDSYKNIYWNNIQTNRLIKDSEIIKNIKNGRCKMVLPERIIRQSIKYIKHKGKYSVLFCNHKQAKGLISGNPSLGD